VSRREVVTSGARLLVTDEGPHNAALPPLFLLHGNPDASDLWDGVLGGIVDRRTVRADMPGFGGSPEPPTAFSYLAGSTVPLWDAVFDEVGLDRPIVAVLHDFGGPWFLPWVARNPHRIAGLVLCNTIFHPSFQWHTWARIWQTPWLGELTSSLSTRALFRYEMRRGSKGLPAAHCDACFAHSTPQMRRSILRTYRAHRTPKVIWASEAERLLPVLQKVPARVVHGRRDPYISAHHALDFDAPVTWLDDVGHWSPVEAPQAVRDAIAWVDRQLSSG